MANEKYDIDISKLHETLDGGVDGFHEAVLNLHGDWRIDGASHKIPVRYILNYLMDNPKTTVKIPIKKIGFKGLQNVLDENYIPSERVNNADMSYPVIVAKGVSNPYFKEYRMIDGAHRATKATLNNETHIDCYVFEKEEFLQLIEDYQSSRWDADEHIELQEIRDFFGFPACIYKFKKHDELKDKLIEELVAKDKNGETYANEGYVRTRPDVKPLLDCEEGTALYEVRLAKEKAYNHFYNEIINADFTLECQENNYNPKLKTTKYSKPKITQSWVVSVAPNASDNFIPKPMSTHAHLLSPVCGAYYVNIDNNDPDRDGGNLVFTNPTFDSNPPIGSMAHLLRYSLRAGGYVKYSETCTLREGYIVLWAGVLYHTIQPFRNTPTDRISIITNSCPDVLSDNSRKYNYNVTPFCPPTEENS